MSKLDSNETYLVTGGSGFLGSSLVDRLIEKGNIVICIDNEFRGILSNIENQYSKNLVYIHGDIRDMNSWPKNVGKIDGVFHLAAINGTNNFYSIPETVLDVNVRGVINTLEFVRKNDIKYLAFASTPETYGIPHVFPTPETSSLSVPDIYNPRWSYGGSKIIGEIFCVNHAVKYGFKCSILRYHNTYGPKDRSGHVIPDLINKLLNNKEFIVEGTGNETRSFCYVDDTIESTLLIKDRQINNTDVFNIGNDVETTIIDLIKKIELVSNKKIEPIFKSKTQAGTTRRIPDLTKIRKLGYKPKISLEDGLKKTYQWHVKSIQKQ